MLCSTKINQTSVPQREHNSLYKILSLLMATELNLKMNWLEESNKL